MSEVIFDKRETEAIRKRLEAISVLKSYKIKNVLALAALGVENKLKDNVSGDVLHVRSGNLRRSISTKIEESGQGLQARIGSGARTGKPVIYAGILEKGGVIRPVKRKWLTIPIKGSRALTPAGVQRFTAPEIRGRSFISKGMIWLITGKKKCEPVFVFKKSVRIPAFKYLSKTTGGTQEQVRRVIMDGLERIAEAAV